MAAVQSIAIEIWNKYFAPVLGMEDQSILAVYSHMVSNPLYLSNYAVGSLIQFQVEQYLEGKDFAEEVKKMYALGRIIPQEWMKQAVGSKLTAGPMLAATVAALDAQE
jgi:oligoendopeptidase F